MKRLLAQIGLTYLFVLVIVFYFGKTVAFVLSGLFLLAFVAFLLNKKCRKTIYLPVMAFVALVACVVNVVYTCTVYDKTVQTYGDYKGVVVAKLKDEPTKYFDSYRYKFTAIETKQGECDFNFFVYHDDLLEIEPFDTVSMNVEFFNIQGKDYISDGYFLGADIGYGDAKMMVYKSEHKPPYYYAIKLRQTIRNFINSSMDKETASLSNALLVGDKYSLPFDVRQDFLKAGVSHLIVVSGLHFSILACAFLWFAKRFHRYRFFSLIPCVLFIFLYMAVTGFAPSVMRSGVMLLIYVVSSAISRDVYSPNSLGLSALVILLISGPYSAGDVGLILSFATTYSIIKLSPLIHGYFHKRIKNDEKKHKKKSTLLLYKVLNICISAISMNISALIVSIPLSIIFFGAVSTVSAVATLVLVIPIQCLLVVCVVMCLLSFLPFTTIFFAGFAQLLAQFIYATVSFFSKLSFSYVYVNDNYVYVWVLFSGVLFALMMFSNSKHKIKATALSIALILIVGNVSATLIKQNTQQLNIYNVDDGIAVVYSNENSSSVLTIDCSKSNCFNVIENLEYIANDIELCASVSNSKQSKKSLQYLSEVFAINQVLMYDTKEEVEYSDSIDKVYNAQSECTVRLSENCIAQYYQINEKYIIYLSTNETTVLILPKNIDASLIPQKFTCVDVIITQNCPDNFEKLKCQTLVVSANENNAYHIMKRMSTICERALLTNEAGMKIELEV